MNALSASAYGLGINSQQFSAANAVEIHALWRKDVAAVQTGFIF
jgi:hypothetical protein